jgi:transcriptional regulator with XRE-family HTH domain
LIDELSAGSDAFRMLPRGCGSDAGSGYCKCLPARARRLYRGGMGTVDLRSEIREFLSSRRARITPGQAGLPAYGGNRRVQGLRREEVAMLAGVSVDYYVRMERGSLSGASESVLDALASALKLDEAERDHLFALARESGTRRSRRKPKVPATIRPALQQVLDAITDAPAWIRNGRHDVLAMNQLARALYAPVLADPRRPANTTRFVYLNPEAAQEFFVDYDQIARDAAAMLRLEVGRNPQDPELITLIGELSTHSELFRQRWASQDVRFHRSGRKRLRHPVVGQIDLDFEALEIPAEPGLQLNIYTAPANTAAADGLRLLGSWAASEDDLRTEQAPAHR